MSAINNNSSNTKNNLNESANNSENSLSVKDLFAIADNHVKNEQYSDAAKVYEKIKNTRIINDSASEDLRTRATRRLAMLYISGKGVNQDLMQAKKLLQQAALQGDSDATTILKKVNEQLKTEEKQYFDNFLKNPEDPT